MINLDGCLMECSAGGFQGPSTGCTSECSMGWEVFKNFNEKLQGNFDGKCKGNLQEKSWLADFIISALPGSPSL